MYTCVGKKRVAQYNGFTVYDVYCRQAHEVFHQSMVKLQREIDILAYYGPFIRQ